MTTVIPLACRLVVRRPINAESFNPSFYISLLKRPLGIIFYILLRASNYQIVDKTNLY